MKKLYYTGVGSRETPPEICSFLTEIARYMHELGITLRSGGAKGADDAFEKGAGENKEIYLPKYKSNDRKSNGSTIIDSSKLPGWKDCILDALRIHPAPERLNDYSIALHARNVNQVLGSDRNTPSIFVIGWAIKSGKSVKGGTRTAFELAKIHRIPVINLYEDKRSEDEILADLSLIVMAASR
jgi:hypothetical protein